jgi:hypothetical protein
MRAVTSGLGNGAQATIATPASTHDALDIVPSYLAPGAPGLEPLDRTADEQPPHEILQ